jgi:hypothetical protein
MSCLCPGKEAEMVSDDFIAVSDVAKTEVIDPWLRAMSSVSCHAILWGGATGELLIVSGEKTRQVFLCRLASPAW